MVKITRPTLTYNDLNRHGGHWIGACMGGSYERPNKKLTIAACGYYIEDSDNPHHRKGYYCEDCVRRYWPHLL